MVHVCLAIFEVCLHDEGDEEEEFFFSCSCKGRV